ncbi:Aste57867_2385 [Aphanomyces stellatus]|uniref:Aste57867_2385 protein n=1 Tax=Aphanomyces stellatus TaxID=120398 RepID=A0A485K8I7_9STRA|nr:hypothetical protein As57867_002379 [Aphanomyces stellatus]VFT79586.1 Aste57867_2385 [Aphanomyces stellatus]
MSNDTVEVPPTKLALTLGFFKHFVEIHGGRDAFQGLTTTAVCKTLVKPFTSASKLSLVDHVLQELPEAHKYVKHATWFVSHAWNYEFLDVVDALTDFFDDQDEINDSDDVAVWFCMFNNNQHVVQGQVPFEYWVDAFETALTSIQNVVMVLSPWHNPTTLTRTWCVFEIYVAIRTNARFEVAMGKTQKQAFLEDIHDPSAFYKMLATIKSERSKTSVPTDYDNICKAITEANLTWADLDRLLFNVLDGWMLRTMQSQVDKAVGAEKAQWLSALATLHCNKTAYVQAKQCIDAAKAIYRDELQDADVRTWKAVADAAYLDLALGQPRAVWEPAFDEALARQTELLGPAHYDTLNTMAFLGQAQLMTGDAAGALPLLERCYAACDGVFGVETVLVSNVMIALHAAYTRLNHIETLERFARERYKRTSEALGLDHHNTLAARFSLSLVFAKQGKYADALPVLQDVVESYGRAYGPTNENTWIAHILLGQAYTMVGQYDKAEQILTKSLDACVRLDLTRGTRDMQCKFFLGQLALCTKDWDRANEWLTQAHESGKQFESPASVHTVRALHYRCLLAYVTNPWNTLETVATWQDELSQAQCSGDTWKGLDCHGCHKSASGTYFTCAKCPAYAWLFCRACVAADAPAAFCTHRAPLQPLTPPMRYVQERRLDLLAQVNRWTDYDAAFAAYTLFCDEFDVPSTERVQHHRHWTTKQAWWGLGLGAVVVVVAALARHSFK